ncbi:MAG: tRNA uridine(34) 5-carboxymethylaminomethyl modification radical SAM/GNAT enzyme Elp3 [Anaerolineae bacterium]|nr:tRNA uridine(34) 5-carboxymethylaminomethyl modification radical SAM/GNAT enzyme Elp3 [Anaerolineae bacterium]
MVKGGVPEAIDLTQAHEYDNVLHLLQALRDLPASDSDIMPILRRYPSATGTYAKSQLLDAYHRLVQGGVLEEDTGIERRLRGRPVRTISGVAPVAVLTEPYPCPGTCIFCPEQRDAPKSYLNGEPGVLRAIQNDYDPYAQTYTRIEALNAIGHSTDKIELLILGGTWSVYPHDYREHFLRRCFDAMNGTESATLDEALRCNEAASHRNVGLAIETRPDWITPEEVLTLRQQAVTKVQLGAQSCDDRILALNRRGHTLDDVRRATQLLRLAGFKIVLHWMPNLYGAMPESDLADFARLWDDPALRPDEIKIYPTALLEGTALYTLWEWGEYQPYPEEVLIDLLVRCKTLIPPYSRINRLMRDIPAQYIVAGTTKSNLRQLVQAQMRDHGLACQCIRCREVRGKKIAVGQALATDKLQLDVLSYLTDATQEHFLQYLTPSGHLAGFLRLSLPIAPRDILPIPEIREVAMVRELHIYGPAQALGERGGAAQHRGLGTQLLDIAADIAHQAGFGGLAVIAAIGTRPYYRERGFTAGNLYPIRRLDV